MAACSQCGSELPPDARFCSACGAAVGARRGEERKVVTVLFADIVDSTAAADERDPEDVRAAVRPQVARMREELERYGGTFEKYVGDAVMAVFGAPIAHEDDPERAVRAALAIRNALPGVRVAVATGEAVVSLAATPGTGEGIATGDVVNTTFRIEEAASDNTVLVGDSTFRATQSAIAYGPRRLLQARGKANPIAVYEAQHARSEFRASYDGPPLAPLIGRKEELSLILDTIARARRDRTVQLVTIVGVPGIGKSRLVWELQQALGDEAGLVTWRRGRCLPYGDGVTYWALSEMIKAQAGVLENDDSPTAEAKLHRAVRDVVADPAEAEWVESHLRPLLGLEAPKGERREESSPAWRRFFESLAEWGPLVLVFEDLHWADEGLLDFVDHLADWATSAPLVLLCTARPELRERRPIWGARANAATIALPPLSESETGALVGYLLRQQLVPAELQQALLRRADGNPLYAEEFVRMLVDRGFLYRDDGGWRLREGELPLPESVQGIIASRLDGLRPQEKDVLRDAAVIGRRFWPGAVAAVAGQAREEVEPILRSLDQKELVRRLSSSSVAGELQYSFRHALVRDVAYGQIPRAERGRRHLLAAGWVESLGRPEDHSETIAHHYLRALEYQDADAFADRAQRALREAGDRAFALNAHGAACRYYEAAVELTSADAEDRPQLLLRYGTALFRARNAGGDVLSDAYEALRAKKQFDLAAEASIGLAELLLTAGERDRAFERLDEATELVREAPASPAKANVLANVSRLLMIADDYERTIDVGRQALALAEQLELDEIRAHALNNIGVARFAMGDADGVSDLERSLELALSINSPESVRAYLNLGTIAANEGDLRRAFAFYDEGRRAARRFGDERGLRWLDAERLYEFYWTSRWDKALALAERLLAADDGPATSEFDARLVRAWIRLARGDESGALEDVDAAAEFGRRAREAQFLLPALAARARVLAHAGQREAAAELLGEILRVWSAEAPSYASFWLSDVASVAVDIGADSFLAECATHDVSTRWLDAAVAFASGRYDESATLYRAIGSAPDEAHARARGAPSEVSEREQI